jgi:hypothetical protein
LLQSPQLQVDSEDILFDLVVDLIGSDPNRKILLRTIFFPDVSSSRLINYFNTLPVEEMDSDLFESLKIRLLCDVFQPNSVPSSRWRNPPTFRSKEESDKIFNLLQSYFHKTSNPVQLIQSLINEKEKAEKTIQEMKNQFQIEKEEMNNQFQNEKEEMKNQLQNVQSEKEEIRKENVQLKNQLQNVQNEKEEMKNQFQEEKEEVKKENVQLKNQNEELKMQNEKLIQPVQQQNVKIENSDSKAVQINLSGYNGIISSLKQNDPNPVSFKTSSNNSNRPPENVLNPDAKFWVSNHIQNSWIQFNLKGKQISPSGYFVGNKSDSGWYKHSPQGWKLEGSNDESKWETIHEVTNCSSFRENDREATFSGQTDKFFSFLRFTQTQENLCRFHNPKCSPNHYFLLNSVEFSGKIIARE